MGRKNVPTCDAAQRMNRHNALGQTPFKRWANEDREFDHPVRTNARNSVTDRTIAKATRDTGQIFFLRERQIYRNRRQNLGLFEIFEVFARLQVPVRCAA